MTKKVLIPVLVLAVLGAAGYYFKDKISGFAAGEKIEKDAGRDEKVVRRDIDKTVDVSGFVEPVIATEVKPEVSGKIVKIYVENGNMVKAGQLLVELDETITKSDEDEANRELTNQRTALQNQQNSLEKAERDCERFKKLYGEGFATEKDMLDAETALVDARLTLERQKIQIEIQESRLAKAAENRSKTKITAPHDGMITNCDINPGQVVVGAGSVNSGTTLLKVNELSQLIVQANLNEFDVAKIEQNPPVTLTFDSIPGAKVTGKLFYISPSGVSTSSTAAASLSTALRVFPIKVSFPSEGLSIRPGISANIRMVIAHVSNSLSVPVSAVFIETGDRVVYLKAGGGKYERRLVKTGINNDSFIEITEGVSENDNVSLIRPSEFM